MLPISDRMVTFSATRIGSSDTYTCAKTNVTLEKGKFYRNLGTITLVRQQLWPWPLQKVLEGAFEVAGVIGKGSLP